MGEYAEMMLNGEACESCGKLFLDDDDLGIPRYCQACEQDELPAPRAKSVLCPGCARRFRSYVACAQHRLAKGH